MNCSQNITKKKSNDFLKGRTNHSQFNFLRFFQETMEKLESIREMFTTGASHFHRLTIRRQTQSTRKTGREI